MYRNIQYAFFALFFGMCLSACELEEQFFSDGYATFEVILQGGPSDFDEVNIDLQNVGILLNSGDDYLAHTAKGVYNLKNIQDDKNVLIVNDTLPSTLTINEITLLLGDRNTIKTKNQLFFLEADSGSLNVEVGAYLSSERHTRILLEIDVAKSILVRDTGKFFLDPIISARLAK